MVLVWTITAEKANIGDEASGCSKDDDTRDSGCSVDAETEWRVPRIKDCP